MVESLRRLSLRSWAEFFEFSQFSAPQSDVVQQRITTNLIYFQANYMLIIVLFLLYVCIARPFFFVLLPLMIAGSVFLAAYQKPIVIANQLLPKWQANLAYLVFCLLLSLIFGGISFFIALLLSLVSIVAHATFRQRSLSSKAVSFLDLWRGGTTPAGAAAAAKSFDDDASDDENPAPVRSSASHGSDDAEGGSGSGGDQQQFRAQFRAKMRQKYLKK